MTLITKFKSGKVTTLENVDDIDHDHEYIYVYMRDGLIKRCPTRAVKYYIARYELGGDVLVYPNNE
jgi:hypothetical protein